MKLAIRRTYLGDRLSFPDVIDGRLVDVQAAYARMLETRGSHRDDAIPRSRREIAETLPALLQADAGARDVSELDNQRMDRGKGFDTFGLVGPWFVTADEVVLDPSAAAIGATG